MDGELTYLGQPVDAAAALALLEWQAELGADEAILDAGIDRYELAQRPRPVMPVAASAPAPVAPPMQADAADQSVLIAQAQALADGADTLATLAAAQESFDGIELKKGARNFCFADGNPKARVMILGEAPGEEEDRQGRPFVGRAGQLLDKMFAAIGLSRDAVDAEAAIYIVNTLPWHPPGNRDPQAHEIALSLPFLRRHIELAAPDIVVLMGNIACEAALGRRGVLRLRGQWATAFDRPVLPMTHPAYLLRNPPAKRAAWEDLLSLSARLDGVSA